MHGDRRCEEGVKPGAVPRCADCGGETLERMRRVAEALAGHEEGIVRLWARHYRCSFGDKGYFSPEAFPAAARREVDETLRHARSGDLRQLATFFLEQGRAYAAMGVPFAEVCRSIHLFEESVVEALRATGRPAAEALKLYLALDHLSHERLVFLVEAYQEHRERSWAAREADLLDDVARRERDLSGRDRCCGLVGRSLPMQHVYESLALASRSRDPVLLVGESGTGKELAARAIHALSGDPGDRFLAVNCAALTHDLLESELFGHRRGAFSGADREHSGLFRAAHGGSLFLDEITELAPVAQAKLLRALQERAVRPVGGIREIPVAIRFITSTNRDLRGALEEGKLRRDLYYRLQHLVIELPPLRERLEDIPLLAGHFLEQAGGEGLPTPPRGISQEAIAHLEMRPWPGNVRELRSAVRLACQRTSGRRIGVADLSPSLPPERAAAPWPRPREAETLPASSRGARAAAASPVSLLGIEREAIMRALGSTDGNKSRAALLLGISRKQLYVKLRRHGMI